MNFRTDLAIELAQQLQDTVSQDYQTVQKEEDGHIAGVAVGVDRPQQQAQQHRQKEQRRGHDEILARIQ